ncbi:Gfo/Idh/MocA family protein [uncultured Microbacterium sp.]|uniref:Gfo/Idh/MocA family protein n=1 Tax=uncultured Microbacterium sp. TaxID=191216 RepID=UPI0025F3E23E|nr:Gfo/Idh/MocA family oxidoreductase [uncultured Microbacterium sp.]
MRVGLIGAGGIAAAHLDAWRAQGAEILLASRTRPTALAARYGAEAVDDVDELVDRVEVVGILSPTPTHLDYALRAIARGRHVVCEKPLTMTAAEARLLADAAEASGVRLFPAHVVRYFDGYLGIKRAVDAGAIGSVRSIRMSRFGAGPTAPWFFDERAGGGLVRDFLIHDIDQALWLAGPVARVRAAQDPPSVSGRLAAPVRARITLTHTNGAESRIDGGWLGAGTPFRTTIAVGGGGGTLAFDSAASGPAVDGFLPPATDEDPYRAQIADFAEAIRSSRPARVGPGDGVAAVAVVDAAYASIAARDAIDL